MAETSARELKHLKFVKEYTVAVYAFLLHVYTTAKANSGSLKPGVERVEAAVYTSVEPVVSKLEETVKPEEYLFFADEKVYAALTYVSDVASPYTAKASEVYDLYSSKGLTAVYFAYVEPLVAGYLFFFWRVALSLPIIPQLLDALSPAVISALSHYNEGVAFAQKKEFPTKFVADALPVVPVSKVDDFLKTSVKGSTAQ